MIIHRCLGKANLVADIRSRAGLVNFAIIFSFDSTLRADSTGRFAAFDYSRIFIGLVRCLLGRLLSGRFRPCVRASVFYLTRTTTGGLDSCGSLLCLSARSHASKSLPGQLGTGFADLNLSLHRAVMHSQHRSTERRIQS